jgi:DNA-binding transcriptional ArsR family regulator
MQVLHGLVDMYLSKDPRKRKLVLDLLESPRGASKLARKLEEWDYGDLSDRALREHAKKIREHWAVLMSAKAEADKKDPNPE